MQTELIIAEKPSVAADIAQALGGFTRGDGFFSKPGIIVTFARGHLVSLGIPKENDPGFNLSKLPVLPSPFHLFPTKDSDKLLRTIASLLGRSDVVKVVNACDAGREGELIFRLIMGYLGNNKPIERMWLQSMTTLGIKAAFSNRRSDVQMKPLFDAAISRSESDWIIGINATRALTSSNLIAKNQLVSAGRVQTPVLTLVVDREAAITSFDARNYWEVFAKFAVSSGNWTARLIVKADPDQEGDRFYKKADAENVLARCAGKVAKSPKDVTLPVKGKAPLPFDLTTLQRVANTKLGLSAAKTLVIAQALYEKHKVATYPRTSSCHLPQDYPDKVKAIFGSLSGPYKPFCLEALAKEYVHPKHAVFNDSKITDHFAIIPTGKAPEGLSDIEFAIYDLIAKRFIAAFFPAAEFSKTTREVSIEEYCFRAVGTVRLSPGWLAVYGAKDDDELANADVKGEPEVILPRLVEGQVPTVENIQIRQGKTKPPSRYTEATLLRAMETAGQLIDDDELSNAMSETGLGTPATRAATIEELVSEHKAYMVRNGKQLHPTPKAIDLVGALRACGLASLTSAEMTGDLELQLAQMEKGLVKRTDFMARVRVQATELVVKIRDASANQPG